MASNQKPPRPRRIRHRIETECESEAEKDALAGRLQRVRELLSPGGSRHLDNASLLNAMFDIVEREVSGQTTAAAPATLSPSMMRNSGMGLPYGSTIWFYIGEKCRCLMYSQKCTTLHIFSQACTQAMTAQMTASCSYVNGMP